MGDEVQVKVPGLEPTFRHVDDPDVTWQQVKAIRNADGSVSSVWEKWLAFSPDPQYLSLYAKWDPGVVVRRHGHYSPHVLFVIEGDMWCGDRHCPAGTHIELPLGAAFGPFVAGEEGTLLFEVMIGDPRSWGDDPTRSTRPGRARRRGTSRSRYRTSRLARGPSDALGGGRPRAMTGAPLAQGSISLRLYPHVELTADEMVRELRHQAVRATEAGFDGVMTSEHHGGFAGYMPNPLQVAGWLLEAMPTGWAARARCSSPCARRPW